MTEPAPVVSNPIRAYTVIVVCGLITLILLLEFTLIYPALPTMAQAFHTSSITWTVIIAEIAGVVAAPLLGKLGDLYGIKRIFLVVAVIFVIGSVLCAVATNMTLLLAGRAMQGLALGLITITYAIVRNVLSKRHAAIGLSVIASIVGIAFIIGPLLSSALLDSVGWRGVFWFCAGYMVVVGVLLATVVPESGAVTRRRLDLPGAVLLGVALALLFVGISEGHHWGWSSAPTLAALVIGALALAGFVLRSLRGPEPLIDLQVLSKPAVRIPILVQVACNWPATMMSVMLPMILLAPRGDLGYGLGITGLGITLYYLPYGLTTLLFGPAIGILVRRGHGMLLLRVSLVSYAAALTLLALFHAEAWQLLLGTGIAGIGHGAAYSAVGYLVADGAPEDQRGAATGVLGAAGIFAGGIATAVLAGILATQMTGVDSFDAPIYADTGFTIAFFVGAGIAVLGLVQTFIRRSSAKPPSDPTRSGQIRAVAS